MHGEVGGKVVGNPCPYATMQSPAVEQHDIGAASLGVNKQGNCRGRGWGGGMGHRRIMAQAAGWYVRLRGNQSLKVGLISLTIAPFHRFLGVWRNDLSHNI